MELRPAPLAGLPWFEGWASLLRCMPPPLPKEPSPAGGEGCHNGGPTLCMPLNNSFLLPWWPRPPLPAFPATEPFLLSPQAASLPPSAIPSQDPPSKPHSPAPSPPPHQETCNPGQGAQGHGRYHAPRPHSVPTPTNQSLLPSGSQTPEGPHLFPLIPLLWVSHPECKKLSSPPVPTRGASLILFPPLFPRFLTMPHPVARELLLSP